MLNKQPLEKILFLDIETTSQYPRFEDMPPRKKELFLHKFRNDFDNSILYITGGVICKLVYEKQGEKGIWELYNSTNSNFKVILEKLFEEPYENIEKTVVEYITNYEK